MNEQQHFPSDIDCDLIARGLPTSNGWPGARLRHGTRCAQCGMAFQAGDEVTAQLAVPIEDGTWRHKGCVDE